MILKKIGPILLFFVLSVNQMGNATPPTPPAQLPFLEILKLSHSYFTNKKNAIYAQMADGSGLCVLPPGSGISVTGPISDDGKTETAIVSPGSRPDIAGTPCKEGSVVFINVDDLKRSYKDIVDYYGSPDDEASGD